MFYKLLTESYRNKVNRPMSFVVNFLGLTLGFAAVIVIYLYIMGELRHDQNVYEQFPTTVYRCEVDPTMGAISPTPLAAFLADMPEVQSTSKLFKNYNQTISTVGLTTNNKFKSDIVLGDSSLLSILPFKLVAGDAKSALSDMGKILVSEAMAIKLYGTTDVVGRTIEIENEFPLQISGVMADVPENSTWRPELLANINLLSKLWRDDIKMMFIGWGHWNYEAYVKLRPGVDVAAFEAKYAAAVQDKISAEWGNPYTEVPTLRAFKDIYFASDSGFSAAKTTDAGELQIMALIAVLILLIAIINYVNIYTARSTEVIRAMGIKSIMGAVRSRLIGFVIFDSVLLTLFSAFAGFVLALALEPLYPAIIGSSVPFNLGLDSILVIFVGLPLLCGVISGIFPALALTRMRPLEAIACKNGASGKMVALRNALIVFQFTITIVLIACTLFINKQMTYMGDMELGYNRANVYVVSGSNFMGAKFKAFRSTLLRNANIVDASLIKNSPINVDEFMTVSWGETQDESLTINVNWADENSLSVLGLHMVEGDSISAERIDSMAWNAMIINETFAKQLRAKIPEITFPYKQFMGVFSDYQSSDLKQNIQPLGIGSVWMGDNKSPAGNGYIRIAGGDLAATLKFIEATFAEFYPNEIYEGAFLDTKFNDMYRAEQLFRARLMTFSILAIFIGCLGLFALVGYSVERRRKEIGVRKSFGSTIAQVVALLGMGFVKWLVISFAIAIFPIWWLMNSWVAEFAYRTDISWWIFGFAFAVAFAVAAITVIWQTYHAAAENPVKSLKSE